MSSFPARARFRSEPTPSEPATDRGGDDELVRAAQRDPRAFGPLYRRHAPAIERYLRRRLGDPTIVEDALAETFVRALEGLAKYEVTRIPFRAWLYRIATSRVGRVRRRAALAAMNELEVEPLDVRDEEREREERDQVACARAALLRLPARDQSVLALHYLEGLEIRDVAAILGVAQGTVKSRLSRGRERLRAEIERSGERR